MEAGANNMRAGIAAALSMLIPGAGQVYAGKWRRGLPILLGLSAQAGLFLGVGETGLLVWLALIWLWNVWDAYSIARGEVSSAFGPVVLALGLNLVAAWQVTEIRAPKLAAEQRGVIRQIVSGLARPDFFAPRVEVVRATAKYVVPGPEGAAAPTTRKSSPNEPRIELEPRVARVGTTIRVNGGGFPPNTSGKVAILGGDEREVARFTTNPKGHFRVRFANPRSVPGDYFVRAETTSPTGGFSISATLADAAPMMFETIYLALIGTALSLVVALPLSFFGARNLMSGSWLLKTIYGATRAAFTVLRSVEVLIFAVIAVAAVGVGPFAGVLALAIHGIGALGKLYSEAIESIEHGPIEAIRSTGANELQVVVYAVLPQVVPQFIAFTLYRWDINVRMATVIGLVGGGGIGFQLIGYMNLLQWRQAATAIWLIAGVVMLMDYASAVIREKVI